MTTSQEEVAFDVVSRSCPSCQGAHSIVEVQVTDPTGHSFPSRICRRCGLRDTYIEEGEP